MTEKEPCLQCLKEDALVPKVGRRTTVVRGRPVEHEDYYYECRLCGETSWGPALRDPLKAAFAAYEELYGKMDGGET